MRHMSGKSYGSCFYGDLSTFKRWSNTVERCSDISVFSGRFSGLLGGYWGTATFLLWATLSLFNRYLLTKEFIKTLYKKGVSHESLSVPRRLPLDYQYEWVLSQHVVNNGNILKLFVVITHALQMQWVEIRFKKEKGKKKNLWSISLICVWDIRIQYLVAFDSFPAKSY